MKTDVIQKYNIVYWTWLKTNSQKINFKDLVNRKTLLFIDVENVLSTSYKYVR